MIDLEVDFEVEKFEKQSLWVFVGFVVVGVEKIQQYYHCWFGRFVVTKYE